MQAKLIKKARRKLLISNMAIFTVLMTAAFALVYAAIAMQTGTIAQLRLKMQGNAYFRVAPSQAPHEFESRAISAGQPIGPQEQSGVVFEVIVTDIGEMYQIERPLSVSLKEGDFEQAVQEAIKAPDSSKVMSFGGLKWRYTVGPVTLSVTNNGMVSSVRANRVRFVDVTDSQRAMRSLLIVLAVAEAFTGAIIFLASWHFANKAIQPLAKALEFQSQFVADASHEFKTPLAIIEANCGVIKMDPQSTVESQSKWLSRIEEGAERMNSLINGMLSMAKIDAQQSIEKVYFDVGALFVQSIKNAGDLASLKGQSFELESSPPLTICQDKERLGQILSILLDNASKYSPEGSNIKTGYQRQSQGFEAYVSNIMSNPVGPSELERLFERFYRGPQGQKPRLSQAGGSFISSHQTGTGLGLAIARSLASSMNGELWAVLSGQGSITFKLSIPLS